MQETEYSLLHDGEFWRYVDKHRSHRYGKGGFTPRNISLTKKRFDREGNFIQSCGVLAKTVNLTPCRVRQITLQVLRNIRNIQSYRIKGV